MIFELTGLDGSNPMGFLAGLGTLAAGQPHWKLGWRDDGTWSAFLEGPGDEEALIEALVADRTLWAEESLLTHTDAPDIKMPPSEFRELAKLLLARDPEQWARSADWLGILGNELATDGPGKNIKPSALHFSAGQQKFLTAVREINRWTSSSKPMSAQLWTALFEIWPRQDKVKSLSWDSTVTRDYALRLKDPSKDGKLAEAGAEWLAFRGLTAFPSAPYASRLHTACTGGRWKTGWMRWPLWADAAALSEVNALLRQPRLASLSRAQREARGIFAVFTSSIQRTDQGGYGSFAPARPARAKDDRLR